MLKREQSPGASETALDLVEDQGCTVPVGRLARRLQKLARALADATLALDRLQHDGAGVAVHRCLHGFYIVQRDKLDSTQHWLKAGAVFVLPSHGERARGAAV